MIANGYPVAICSSIGFNTTADSEGLLRPGPKWRHSMLLVGIDTKSEKQAGLIINSWGSNWWKGPKYKLPTPDGGFWTDAKTIDRMLRQGESFALSNYKGYPRRYDLFRYATAL